MSRIADKFSELKRKDEGALIPFLVGGAPNLATCEKILLRVAKSGADVIEIGVPFSDPLADGPVIQAASQQALAGGANMKAVLGLVAEFRQENETPIALMTYYNPVLQYGLSDFAQAAAVAGADGVIISDLPPEEAGPWKQAADSAGLDTIFLLAPTSNPQRVRLVGEIGSGFIYCVSRTGVTGARKELPPQLAELVDRIRAQTEKPIGVGFGISTPDQVRVVCDMAEGVVVGSALVNLISEHSEDDSMLERVGHFIESLKSATQQ